MKLRWPNLGRWLLAGIGLAVGAGGGWWFTLKDWQREDLLFRAKWAMTKRLEQVSELVNLPIGRNAPIASSPPASPRGVFR